MVLPKVQEHEDAEESKPKEPKASSTSSPKATKVGILLLFLPSIGSCGDGLKSTNILFQGPMVITGILFSNDYWKRTNSNVTRGKMRCRTC